MTTDKPLLGLGAYLTVQFRHYEASPDTITLAFGAIADKQAIALSASTLKSASLWTSHYKEVPLYGGSPRCPFRKIQGE